MDNHKLYKRMDNIRYIFKFLIAHELGHGYFQLKHPFEMGLKQGDLKDNLMDYEQGVAFNKYEWDLMHNPGIVTGLFESDTSGMFSITIHQEIMREAINIVRKEGKNIPKEWEDELVSGVANTDYLGFSEDFHFDNRRSFDMVNNTFIELNGRVQTIKSSFNAYQQGVNFNTLMDFYAHSNFVELYLDYWINVLKNNIKDLDSTKIPIYEIAIVDNNFLSLCKRGNNLGLHTGEFNVWKWLIGIDKSSANSQQLTHHDEINKDEPGKAGNSDKTPEGTTTTYHVYARETAIKAVVKKLKSIVP